MLYTLTLALFLGFEIQKLIQFNFFFKMQCLLIDYKKSIPTRVKSVLYKEVMKLSIVDLFYLIALVIGLFTVNEYLICGILILSILQTFSFKHIKNKTIRKIIYITDSVLTAFLLLLSIINLLFYNVNGIEFIKQFGSNLNIW